VGGDAYHQLVVREELGMVVVEEVVAIWGAGLADERGGEGLGGRERPRVRETGKEDCAGEGTVVMRLR
jgi:hypothetical protein